ncbi:cationic amino acid transporter 1-like isoform X1 [Telopea speciosissima]|uniref:cationic amino acid transporter 1-like isoform X1 n=1 Tax=Telopea speciosissima TaxID=54955 RepID=UPI001CC77658|nr:cationic amino acid transporter 1-like isoform X1 [Telopea speciosissima]
MEGGDSGALRKRGCCFTKDDFLPEESFKSWGNYGKAFGETGTRLKDRLLTRSLDEIELNEVKATSQNDMKKSLSWWDLIWLGVGAVIGSGIFVLTGQEAKEDAGPAVVLSYAISGLTAMLSVFCYTEFAVEIPVAGGSFAYLRVEMGDFVAFIAAGNIMFEYLVSCAAVARSCSSYLATLFNKDPNFFRITAHILPENYNKLDLAAVFIIIVLYIVAILSTKVSSRFNYITSMIHVITIGFIIVAGLTKADIKNYSDFAPYGTQGIFRGAAVLFFSFTGFDVVSTLAEETKNPARDIPIGLVGSMSIITLVYCIMAATLCLMQPYDKIDPDAPFSIAFNAAGMGWAKYIVAFGALKGMISVLLVCAIGQARYLTHIARTHMVPPCLARVNAKFGTPVNATVVILVGTAAIAFFTSLDILSDLVSISTLFVFMLVAMALLVRRYYVSGVTSPRHQSLLIVFLLLIFVSSIVIAVLWGMGETRWAPYAVPLIVWFLSTLGIRVFVPQSRNPKVWGAPLVPWLPSLSIVMDVFLLGSIEGKSFMRFGLWTVLLLVYYFFVGLHASYDTAKETFERRAEATKQFQKIEEGITNSGT